MTGEKASEHPFDKLMSGQFHIELVQLFTGLCREFCFDGTVSLHATTDVGKAIDNGATHLVQEVEQVFCGSLAYLIFGISIAVFFISKNDKAKHTSLLVAIGTVISYIVIKVLASDGGGAIGKTMDEMTEWVQ